MCLRWQVPRRRLRVARSDESGDHELSGESFLPLRVSRDSQERARTLPAHEGGATGPVHRCPRRRPVRVRRRPEQKCEPQTGRATKRDSPDGLLASTLSLIIAGSLTSSRPACFDPLACPTYTSRAATRLGRLISMVFGCRSRRDSSEGPFPWPCCPGRCGGRPGQARSRSGGEVRPGLLGDHVGGVPGDRVLVIV